MEGVWRDEKQEQEHTCTTGAIVEVVVAIVVEEVHIINTKNVKMAQDSTPKKKIPTNEFQGENWRSK